MADLTPQDDPEGCFVAPDNLSPKHQDLLRLSPLLREHCSGKLLTREEEMAEIYGMELVQELLK